MSNLIVISFLQRLLRIVVIGAFALLFLVFVVSQIEQRTFRRRAELLLSQLQSLELKRTSWSDAQQRLKHWDAESKFDDKCSETECSVEITLLEPVYGFFSRNLIFVHLDDYLRWRLRLSYDEGPFVRMVSTLLNGYMLTGGRPARIIANVGMRNGVVWSEGFSIYIESYWHNIPAFYNGRWFQFTLGAAIHRVPQLDFSAWSWLDSHDPQLKLHPSYFIGRPGGCEICVSVYVYIAADAAPADVHRLTQPNLSCLTRIRPCVGEGDIMPAAWKQYLAEHPHE